MSFGLVKHRQSVQAVHSTPASWNRPWIFTGDDSGSVCCWDLLTRRVVFEWKAHVEVILSIRCLSPGVVMTHTKIGEFAVWKLPIDDTSATPVLLKFIETNALSFCACASAQINEQKHLVVYADSSQIRFLSVDIGDPSTADCRSLGSAELPSHEITHPITQQQGNDPTQTSAFGSPMSLSFVSKDQSLWLVCGAESGHVVLAHISIGESSISNTWMLHFLVQTQPCPLLRPSRPPPCFWASHCARLLPLLQCSLWILDSLPLTTSSV